MPMTGKPLGPGGFRFPLAVMFALLRGFHSTAPAALWRLAARIR